MLSLRALLALAALASGCATLTPQIFSQRFDSGFNACLGAAPPPGSPAAVASGQTCKPNIDAAVAIAEAQDLQGRYASAVTDHGNVGARSSAALIGLGALALF